MTSCLSLLDLPYRVILLLFDYLDNLDGICLVLSCSCLYAQRDSLLRFDISSMYIEGCYTNKSEDIRHVTCLNSFLHSIDRSLSNININIEVRTSDDVEWLQSHSNGNYNISKLTIVGEQPSLIPPTVTSLNCHLDFVGDVSSSSSVTELIVFGDGLPVDIPSSITTLDISNCRAGVTDTFEIPSTVSTLTVYASQFSPLSLPHSITTLDLHAYYCYLGYGVIPDSVTKLTLREYDYDLQAGDLPQSIKYLNLYFYNNSLEIGSIPDGVECLITNNFNRPLEEGVIPHSVTRLEFGKEFDQELYPGAIPESVSHLRFGDRFRHCTRSLACLPPSVVHLCLGDHRLTPGNIPASITELVLGGFYDRPFDHNAIPPTVTSLTIGRKFFTNDIDNLPSTLKTFRYDGGTVLGRHLLHLTNLGIGDVRIDNIDRTHPSLGIDHPLDPTSHTTFNILRFATLSSRVTVNYYNVHSQIRFAIRFLYNDVALFLADSLVGGFIPVSKLMAHDFEVTSLTHRLKLGRHYKHIDNPEDPDGDRDEEYRTMAETFGQQQVKSLCGSSSEHDDQ
ncbi:hypothetical protein SAMD00019534_081810 [Acytostelium subglobosum LB1]|uniref:hypothetical protein n=1 Tax=Acytostelium subglobosum LB1 TaxID=1410327 RepID=UPI000644D211|nr:hypothetical protein SAMD00019534_081810 [Acytostelium subglobosum LB1]GAM25006.1 hypothetical protein SAMD00019534_081810 [Acytostelium subglobosum LB1]|eukprot:XP_012752095.1 hypothetical protein SAMD00019534_081810 [Acytostelium subglobosum LB1]